MIKQSYTKKRIPKYAYGTQLYDAKGNPIDEFGNPIGEQAVIGSGPKTLTGRGMPLNMPDDFSNTNVAVKAAGNSTGTGLVKAATGNSSSSSGSGLSAGTVSTAANFGAGVLSNFESPQSANVGLKTAEGALSGAAAGATIGSEIGPYGTVIGGAIGASVGGVASYFGAKKQQHRIDEQKRQRLADISFYQNQRSRGELMQYPTSGIPNAQYYAKGGMVRPYCMAEGGDPKTKPIVISRPPITFPTDADYWKNNPLITEHADGSIRLWGENPSALPTTDIQKLKNANVLSPEQFATKARPIYYPSNSGGGNSYQPSGPTIPVQHASPGYYSAGGAIRRKKIIGPTPPVFDIQTQQQPNNPDANYSYSTGGQIANPQYEAEKGEVVQGNPILEQSNQLASDMHQVGGNTHEQGGTDGIGGERIFSDRLKVSDELAALLKERKISVPSNSTYADAATRIGRLKGKMEDKTKTNFQPSINTGNRGLSNIDEMTEALFQDQEMQKAVKPTAKYAMGGRIVPKYAFGEDLNTKDYNDTSTYKQYDESGNPVQGSFVADSPIVSADALHPDVHPSFGHQVLSNINSAVRNNSGEITNFGNYLANMGSIHGLDTTVKRSYLGSPSYSYVNRSGEAVNENNRTFRNAIRSLTGSSKGVSASNIGAIYAATLDNNSKIANNENLRHDAYNESFGQRSDRISEFNTGILNQASDAQRDLNNNKNVVLPLQARNAWLQGVMANQQVKAQQRNDRVKMALALASNDQNGVMSRFLKNYNNGGKEKLKDLLSNYGFGTND